MSISAQEQAAAWSRELDGASVAEILQWTVRRFAHQAVFASSLGLEDQVLTSLIARHARTLPIFTLDTGRLFPETYDLLIRTERRYGLKIKIYFPEASDVERLVNEYGLDCYRQNVDLRRACCQVRKVQPLRRALAGHAAWVCGVRREQAVTRRGLDCVEWDSVNGLFKINPLADWTDDRVWAYIREQEVPYHSLHDQGFPSIGCACCTRAVTPGEDIRAGRWWWESPEHKECGLHRRKEMAPAQVASSTTETK